MHFAFVEARLSAVQIFKTELHEAELEKVISAFKKHADPKAARTYVYDYVPHKHSHLFGARLSLRQNGYRCNRSGGCRLPRAIISLYRTPLIEKAEIPEVTELVQPLLDMEEHETKRLVRQTERMDDLLGGEPIG